HPGDWPQWQVLASGAFLALSVTLVLWRLKRNPWLAVGWFWYLGLLVPVIGLVQVGMQSIADRYTYLPSIGIALMLVWSLPARLFESQAGRAALATVSLGIVAALSVFTWRECTFWKNSKSIYERAIAVSEGNYVAHQILAHVLAREYLQTQRPELLELALRHFETAVAIKPSNPVAYLQRGNLYENMLDYPAALAEYDRAIEVSPQSAAAYNCRAWFLATAPHDRGRNSKQAVAAARQACELSRWRNPDMVKSLAAAYAADGDFDQAVRWIQEAMRLAVDTPPLVRQCERHLQKFRQRQPVVNPSKSSKR